ncbi:MAG: hypothetical protein HY836_09060 [Aquabacterium sp.]|uniref:hypothetical protein n=1 Tax=Aquabacterium sp. TaxID=1872578 RepID=UPI0025BAFFAC|nr:hypothetical protein [Aquabacterium sp.]MBI5925734.1 hypothetical protein [Aquabacterium sp.]
MMRPNAWALWSGSGGLPAVHRTAALFWLAGGAMVLAWVVGLVHEAIVWGSSPLLLTAGLSVAVGWCWLAWSTWSVWRADQAPMTLLWTGPVREVEEDGIRLTVGGFRLAQWDAAVRIEVQMDLQRWMLLRVISLNASSPRQTWLWLDAKAQRPGAAAPQSRDALHQLRSLLYLAPQRRSALPAKPSRRGGAVSGVIRTMASWLPPFKSGSKLRSSVMPPGSLSGLSHLHSGAESVFPSTLVMRDEDRRDGVGTRAGERS